MVFCVRLSPELTLEIEKQGHRGFPYYTGHEFPDAPEGFNAVLGQLARWFYPFGSGAHCNNYHYRS